MSKKAVISIMIITIVILSFSGCASDKITEQDKEKYNISETSIVLQEILKNLYKEDKVNPIIYREQAGADSIFEEMKVEHENFEGYAFLYNTEKQEYIMIGHSAVFHDEFVFAGFDRIFMKMFEEHGDSMMENFYYVDVGEYIVFIKHPQADAIYEQIEKGITNWDSSVVEPVI